MNGSGTKDKDDRADQSIVSLKILEYLKDNEYSVRESKGCLLRGRRYGKADWNASSTERGIRIEIRQDRHSPSVHLKVKKRTIDGRFLLAEELHLYDDTPQEVRDGTPRRCIVQIKGGGSEGKTLSETFEYISALRGEDAVNRLRNKDDLKEPMRFKEGRYEICKGNGGKHLVQSLQHFMSCRLVSVCSINHNLEVNEKNIAAPDEECWFLISGSVIADTKYDITSQGMLLIVNGTIDGYYAVRQAIKNDKYKITNNTKPGDRNIDYEELSEADQDMIRYTVKQFLTGAAKMEQSRGR